MENRNNAFSTAPASAVRTRHHQRSPLAAMESGRVDQTSWCSFAPSSWRANALRWRLWRSNAATQTADFGAGDYGVAKGAWNPQCPYLHEGAQAASISIYRIRVSSWS